MRLSAWIVVTCYLSTVSGRSIEYLRASTGTCRSPNYPDPYGNSLSKDCEITVRPGFMIKMIFTLFDLEDSYDRIHGPCIYDFVIVSDASGVIGRFCGNSYLHPAHAPRIYHWIYSKNNTMRIHFESDYSNENIDLYGFSAEYAETDIDECALQSHEKNSKTENWDELITCNHYCTNTLGSYHCSCRLDFQLHENGHICYAKFCENQLLTGLQGDIMSPDYPASYAKLSNCVWDIQVLPGYSINLIFSQDFDIEKHADEGCVFDLFTITYKTNSDRFCGRTPPHNGSIWDLNTNEARIEFNTDLSVEKMGFKLHYNTTRIKCLKHPRAPVYGSIPPNYKGYYEFEDNVTFSCYRGYEIYGNSSVIVCQSNGEWDFKEPICKIKSCGRPEHLIAVKFSSIENFESKVFTYLENVTVVCDKWYEQKSGYSTWRCEDSKNWTIHSGHISGGTSNSTIPICRPICGKSGRSRETRHPWIAFVNIGADLDLKDYQHFCTGSLISPRYVVTAAHCLVHGDPKEFWPTKFIHVWLGVYNRIDNSTARYVTTSATSIHPNYTVYKGGDVKNDIGLIRLSEKLVMNDYIRPVCLPLSGHQSPIRVGEAGAVTGWAMKINGLRPGFKLRTHQFPVVSLSSCQEELNLHDGLDLEDGNLFCAGYLENPITRTCRGNSGGPFTVTENGTVNMIGLVSIGSTTDCNFSNHTTYTVFTKLTDHFNRWIRNTTNDLDEH